MSFVHPLLLVGLLLIGIPVLIHLIMQQKPKHLAFPAFRFLQKRHRVVQRTLRLRHLLLLLLRILLIACLCLALARPRLFSERLTLLGADSPVAVAMVFDTSSSMEYTANRKTRLEEAQQRARELLDELPEGSRVAVLDSADMGGEWVPLAQAREAVEKLQLRPANAPVTRQLAQALRLFENLGQEDEPGAELPPRFLYVFSDRTQESWDENEAKGLALPPNVSAVFVDVGVEQAADLAVANLELPRQALAPGERLEVRATVQATGEDYDTFATLTIDGDAAGDKRPVKLRAGQSQVLVFERALAGLQPGPHRVEVKLAGGDALPYDDVRFATFEVRGGRKVLTIADKPRDARIWDLALNTRGLFPSKVMTPADAAELDPQKALAEYRVICLLDVAEPDRRLWGLLEAYVQRGGSLAILPGTDLKAEAYQEATKLVPARFKRIVETDKGTPEIPWSEAGPAHPMLARFAEWRKSADVHFFKPELLPRVARYWDVEPDADGGAVVVVKYADDKERPALVERTFGEGRVLLFTTGFDGRKDRADNPYWNNYLATSFYLVLANEAVGYLAGDAEEPSLNFVAGQTVTVALPPVPRFPLYTLEGPPAVGGAVNVPRPTDLNKVPITQQAAAAGNYTLYGAEHQVAAGFSINVRPEECQLNRVPAEKIEAVLGTDAVLPLGHSVSLHDALLGHLRQPLELLPLLMVLLLVALALESLLANRFYRNQPQAAPANETEAQAEERRGALTRALGQALVGGVVGLGAGAVVGLALGLYRGDASAMAGWAAYGACFGALFWPLENARVRPMTGALLGAAAGAVLGVLFFLAPASFVSPSESLLTGALVGAIVGAIEGYRVGAWNRLTR